MGAMVISKIWYLSVKLTSGLVHITYCTKPYYVTPVDILCGTISGRSGSL